MSTNKQLSLSFGGPRALPRHHNLPAAKSVCVCYLCVLPVCVTPYHKTVVAVNAPSARVTEGAPIKNTHSLPNSAQTHQNDDDGLLTHPQDLDAPLHARNSTHTAINTLTTVT